MVTEITTDFQSTVVATKSPVMATKSAVSKPDDASLLLVPLLANIFGFP
jgi:hypothetical protein